MGSSGLKKQSRVGNWLQIFSSPKLWPVNPESSRQSSTVLDPKQADIQVLNINWFQKQPNGNEEVSLTLNISADLQSLFTWNAKQVFVFGAAEYETPQNALNQVSLWDGIIPSKEDARFWIHTTNKYRFIDQGSNLRSKDFNLTLHWHVMPKTGKMSADKIVMIGYRLPDEYR